MNRNLPRVVILGAGPAGVGAGRQLRLRNVAEVAVLEQQAVPGGNAGSFEFGGMRVDYGSHRLHPSCDAAIMADIRSLLGADLLDRPRHGRIRLRGRWIHFPLKPADLLLRLDKGFAVASLRDMAMKPFRKSRPAESFSDALLASLGPTICGSFYFPYARKMWGRLPTELSAIQAQRRVSANSFSKLLRKVASSIPGLKPAGAGRFFYPRHGYGQICEAYANDAARRGADIRYQHSVRRIVPPLGDTDPWIVESDSINGPERLEADHLWSTIPIARLVRLVDAKIPPAVLQAADSIESRAMILIYLELPIGRFTEFDAHYFPGADVSITRLSEPKNYSDLRESRHSTVLCAELPCSANDSYWTMSDIELGEVVAGDLRRSGIPLPVQPSAIRIRRLPHAYPVYTIGYERWFGMLDAWVEGMPRLLSYGRQGLFAHDNTHHALSMAYAAAECLGPNGFDIDRWRGYRQAFESHVVED